MRKRLVFIVMLNLVYMVCYSQNDAKNLDFVVVIDEQVWVTQSNTQLILVDQDSVISELQTTYHPGNLSFEAEDYEKLMSSSIKAVYLKITYFEYVEEKQNIYNYVIPINKNWLKENYLVLHIYNLSKKKYRRVFDPLSFDKNYTFEISSPNNTFLRVKRKR
jgi:hypothetical protein